jgi:hypothetical protein
LVVALIFNVWDSSAKTEVVPHHAKTVLIVLLELVVQTASVYLVAINKPLAQLGPLVTEFSVFLVVPQTMTVSMELFAELDSVNWVVDQRMIVSREPFVRIQFAKLVVLPTLIVHSLDTPVLMVFVDSLVAVAMMIVFKTLSAITSFVSQVAEVILIVLLSLELNVSDLFAKSSFLNVHEILNAHH